MIRQWLAAGIVIVLTGTSSAFGQTGDDVTYYHTDAIGSVRAITDANGQIVAREDFLPFGEPWSAPPNPDVRQFAGQERDADTGFDYVGARYYASQTGRFTTVDPAHVNGDVFDPQSWNAYAYARNNPLKYTDPTGHAMNFFTGLADTFTAPLSGVKGASSAFPGFISGLLPMTRGTEGYLIGQALGQQAEGIYNVAINIASGVATIVAGVYLCITGVGAPAGVSCTRPF